MGDRGLFKLLHQKVAGAGPYFGADPAARRIRTLACPEDV